jgi:hypothetical protein
MNQSSPIEQKSLTPSPSYVSCSNDISLPYLLKKLLNCYIAIPNDRAPMLHVLAKLFHDLFPAKEHQVTCISALAIQEHGSIDE